LLKEKVMSNSKLNVAAVSVFGSAKNVHYAVSTFAAVVYALVWLLTGRAQAEQTVVVGNDTIPEFVITAQREKSQDGLEEIVVWGTRESAESVAELQEIVVWGDREQLAASSAQSGGAFGASAKSNSGWGTKVRHWLRSAVM
jgi:hypothetical protein